MEEHRTFGWFNKSFTKTVKLVLLFSFALISSCDDGKVIETTHNDSEDTYCVRLTCHLKGAETWSGRYTLALAGFDSDNDYSIIQKSLIGITDNDSIIVMSGIPRTVSTIEIAVVNPLRKRIAAIHTTSIDSERGANDTLHIDLGDVDAGMFATINRLVFQGSSTNCSRCHASSGAAAKLDLSTENAYASLVGVKSSKRPETMRVKPYDADGSYLLTVLTEGDPNVHYQHQGLMVDFGDILKVIREWIDSGARP